MRGYLSIQEFSKISGVEVTTLRYWDDSGIFSPIKRDPENNYRCYSLEQITALNFVTTLSDLGVPLKIIAELRKKRDAYNLLTVLDTEARKMEKELRTLRDRASIIQARRDLINLGLNIDETQIKVVYRETDWSAILWPRNQYQEGDTFLEPLTAHINEVVSNRINLGFPVGGRYDSMETFLEAPDRPQHFFSIDPAGANTRKKGEYLVGYTRGYYGDFGDLPERMAAYAKEHDLKLTGRVYATYPFDEICTQEPDQYLAQVMVAVSKPRRRLQ